MRASTCSHGVATIVHTLWYEYAQQMLLLKRRGLPSTTYISSQTRAWRGSHDILTHRQGHNLSPTNPQLCSHILQAF